VPSRPPTARPRSGCAASFQHYADARRDDWQLDGPVRLPARPRSCRWAGPSPTSRGHNWALIGDAAGCVNPPNGEGIDYGLETGRLVAELLADERHLGAGCPAVLRRHYVEAFSIARRLAGLLTLPRLLPVAGPVGMRSRALMTVALRVMGNLVTDEDRDLTARAWRTAGRLSLHLDERPPFA
jgi:flavin-dependent dehydrogenase